MISLPEVAGDSRSLMRKDCPDLIRGRSPVT